METLSSTIWQRKGSCFVFDQTSLGQFISADAVVSLRELLSWRHSFPSELPVEGRTLLVSGLEALIETLPPEEAESFLAQRIRPLIIDIQNRWTDCGLVFGFSSHAKAFEEISLNEEVIFHRRDRQKIRLSEGLWDGTAPLNMKRLLRQDQDTEKEISSRQEFGVHPNPPGQLPAMH